MEMTEQDGVDLVAAAQKTAEESELAAATLVEIRDMLAGMSKLLTQVILNQASTGIFVNRLVTIQLAMLAEQYPETAEVTSQVLESAEGDLVAALMQALEKLS